MDPTRNDPRLLRGLHYFEAVARLGSVGLAATEIGVSSSAVSHQLRELTGIIGEQLIVKQGRGIALTEPGRRLAAKLHVTFSELNGMISEVVGHTPMQLSLGVCSCFGPSWLVPRLPDFFARHPDVNLEIRLYSQDPEQTFSTADAVITADPVRPAYESILLFEELMVAVRKPAMSPHGAGLPQRLITTDLKPEILGRDWLDFCRQTGRDIDQVKAGEWVKCTHYIIALEMAKAGIGTALVPDFLAAQHVGHGGLAYVDHARVSALRSYRLCFKTKRASEESIRLFSRWIRSQVAQFLATSPTVVAL